MVNLGVDIAGVRLDNPVIAASGTFGYGKEFARLYDINMLGSFSFKGTTLNERFGNETPRIAETPSGMLNAVGLQNPGIEHVMKNELADISKIYKKPVIANISGFSVEEYVTCCKTIDKAPQVGIIEVNISCPNVHCGGMSFGTSAESAAEITKAVKAVCTKPVFMKLTPNVTDIVSVAKACEEAGADGISMINTLLGMRIDIKKRCSVLANRTGGLSGPAILPVALRMVYDVYEAVKIPIMGMGGITTAEDVIEMMLAGASCVQVGAANLKDPYACKKIIEELPVLCETLGIEDIQTVTGGAH